MALLRVHNLLVTLDGFAVGEDQSITTGFGHAQAEFLAWFDRARLWRDGVGDVLGVDDAIASGWGVGIGAEIMGRRKYRPVTGPWPDDDWPGWWGDEPAFHTPCFVMTHYPIDPVVKGMTTFHFVSGSPEHVLALATEAADGLDVRLGGGPTTIREFLTADLVDYLHIISAPIVIGRGIRLWDGFEGIHRRFDIESVTAPSGVTHHFFRRTRTRDAA
jgi:dihydrofolate reductase